MKGGPVIVFEAEYDMTLGCEILQYRGERGHGIANAMSEDYRYKFHGLLRAALGDFGRRCTDSNILPDAF